MSDATLVIVNRQTYEDPAKKLLFWSTELNDWTSLEKADRYSENALQTLLIPEDGLWVQVAEVKRGKGKQIHEQVQVQSV